MDNLEAVYEYAALSGGEGVSAEQVSEYLGVWRGDAASALNALMSKGRLVKLAGRPARFRAADAAGASEIAAPAAHYEGDEPFSRIIGYNGSLKFQTQMARAAVAYPTHGIHTLIVGEAGVGKSLLASEMGAYMQSIRSKPAPFVVFNCAEYSDNPQLLLSELFGYVKGAFTGAESDKDGLIERANGGILFLDEIHRLPDTGQEMFFTVVDCGVYRRMGDTCDREVRFMLIGATTEAPESFLLNTFKRRMQLTIQMPVLRERPINERLDIIKRFVFEESRKMRLRVRLSYLSLKIMTSFRGENNIGELRNEIQIACARCYLEYMQQGGAAQNETLDIDIYHLSRKLSVNYAADDKVDRYFAAIGLENGLVIFPDSIPELSPSATDSASTGMDIDMDGRFNACHNSLMPAHGGITLPDERDKTGSQEILCGSVAPHIWSTTNELIHFAQQEFGGVIEPNVISSVAYYLQQLKAYADAGRIIFSPTHLGKSDAFPRERQFVEKMIPLLRNRLNLDIMDGEAVLLAALLAYKSNSPAPPERQMLLISFGQVASSMAMYVNRLLNTRQIKAFDLSDMEDMQTARFRLTELIEGLTRDTLVLCDLGMMPTLTDIAESAKITCHYRIIPVLDTMVAIECAQMLLTSQDSIDEIVTRVNGDCEKYFGFALQPVKPSEPAQAEKIACRDEAGVDMRDVIITYCITGTGSARAAREILRNDYSLSSSADILPLGIMDDIAAVTGRLGKRLKLVIGIVNPNIPGVPFIGIEQLLYSQSPEKLLQIKGILPQSNLEIEERQIRQMSLNERLAHCQEHLEFFAPSTDSAKADSAARLIIKKIGEMYPSALAPDLAVRLYVHCATMFERIITSDPIPMPLDGYAAMEHNASVFRRLKVIIHEACKELRLTVEDAETYYLMMTLPDVELL